MFLTQHEPAIGQSAFVLCTCMFFNSFNRQYQYSIEPNHKFKETM